MLASASAQTGEFPTNYPFTFSKEGDDYHLTLGQNSAVYFGLQYSPDLIQPFTTISMALGTPGPEFVYTPLPTDTEGFFRVMGISVYAPLDSDHDGIDDIWELKHGLNPLDPGDASLPSAEMPGLTNLQYYQLYNGLSSTKPQYYSREVSLFNFGAHITSAVSREVSLFNFGSEVYKGNNAGAEALSREISVFNGESFGDAPPVFGYPQTYSREVSLYNFGSALFNGNNVSAAAFSREVSVFNGDTSGDAPPIPGYPQIYSREVSVFNFGAPILNGTNVGVEVISREISVLNNIPE